MPNLIDQHGRPLTKPTTERLDPFGGTTAQLASWMYSLPNPDDVLRKAGKDVRAYFEILRHPQTFTVVETRRSNFLRRGLIVAPADPDDTDAVERADFVRAELARLDVESVRTQLWWAAWLGYSVAAVDWDTIDGHTRVSALRGYPPHLVAFDRAGKPILNTGGGLVTPGDARVIVARTGSIHGWDHYGLGCAKACYWPAMFGTWLLKPWAEDVEKYATSKVFALVPNSWYETQDSAGKRNVDNLSAALTDFAKTNTMVAPGRDDITIDVLKTAPYSSGLTHKQFQEYIDSAVTKITLGQTLSTDGGAIGSGSEALGRVQAETGLIPRVELDCKMVARPLTDLARLMCRYRYGDDTLAPTVDFDEGQVTLETLRFAVDLGLSVSHRQAYQLIGLEPPREGEETLSQPIAPTMQFADDPQPKLGNPVEDAYLAVAEYHDEHGSEQPPDALKLATEEALATMLITAYTEARVRERRAIESRLDLADPATDLAAIMGPDEAAKILLRLRNAAGVIAKDDLARIIHWARMGLDAGVITDLASAQSRTVVNTNLQSALERGRYDELTGELGKQLYQYFRYDAVDDGRVRPSHKRNDGLIFRSDDPQLADYWPPIGYNCRCTMIPMTAAEVGNRPVKGSTGGRPPDEGFSGPPGSHLGL